MPVTFPWPVHPAAELFPLLGGEDLAELTADVKAHGLHEAVWLYRDPDRGVMLLDGRNRYRACEQSGVELRMRYYEGADPIAFSLSLNMKRRHLTRGQISFLALQIEPLYASETKRGRPPKETEEMRADLPAFNPDANRSRERAAGDDKDKPPRLQGFRVGHPVPDLDIAKTGTRLWMEVKSKSRTIFWRKTQKHQHGIDLRLLEHYQTVEKITGSPCWIAIYEEWTGVLLAQTISKLGEPRIGLNTFDGKKLANWDRDRFLTLHVFPLSAN